jgi:hypothetical protein
MKKPRQTHHIDTRLTQEEYQIITLKAENYGIKRSQYMRNLALNYPLPPCRADQRVLLELISIHKNLNRIGGLFKYYLASNQDERTSLGDKSYTSIEELVDTIEATSQEILFISQKLL